MARTVGVKFPGSNKIYHYFTDNPDLHAGCKIEIDSPHGRTTVTVVDVIKPQDSHATKYLPIIKNESKTKVVAKVHYINNDCSRSKPYYYYLANKQEAIDYMPRYRFAYLTSVNKIVEYELIMEDEDKLLPYRELLPITYDRWVKGYKKIIDTTESMDALILSNGWFCNSTVKDTIKHYINADMLYPIQKLSSITLKIEDKKENENMNMNKMFGNIEFGKVNTRDIMYSVNGIAFKSQDNRYFNYDLKNMNAIDVTGFTFESDFIFCLPVTLKDIKVGDVIKHCGNYVIVKEFYEDGTISVINPIAATETTILPQKNLFGFNYYTKVINMFEGMTPNAENPFGDMTKALPMMMMMSGDGFNSDMLPLMFLAGGADFQSNPMLMMAMMQR